MNVALPEAVVPGSEIIELTALGQSRNYNDYTMLIVMTIICCALL